MPMAVEIANVSGCTVYDALFVALAGSNREEGAAFVTADERLMRMLESSLYGDLLVTLSRVNEFL